MRKVLYNILLAANTFFVLSLLTSYLAVHINPADFALPAFFGLAYPYLLLVNIIFVIVWAMLLKFEALISVVVIAIGFTHFMNYIKLAKPSEDKSNTFKVISYNIHLFNYFESSNAANSEKNVIEFLKTQDPDVLCLQEIFVIGNPAQKETTIRKGLGKNYYSHMKVIGSGKNRYFGIATYTKYPIIRRGEIIHPGSASLSIYTDILIKKDTVRIYNNHLQSFRLKRMERSLLTEMTDNDEQETLSEVRSLSTSLKDGFIRRSLQAHSVKEHINRSPYPVIITGDFNDTPVSFTYRKIRRGLYDAFVKSGYGAGFTYKGNYPANRIDYILYDETYISTFFEILRVKHSDHYPIVAYFRKRS